MDNNDNKPIVWNFEVNLSGLDVLAIAAMLIVSVVVYLSLV